MRSARKCADENGPHSGRPVGVLRSSGGVVGSVAALLALAALAAGCTSGSLFNRAGGDGSSDRSSRASRIEAEASTLDTDGLAIYLATMQQLIDGDSLTQAEIFNELEDSAEYAPTTRNRLLYALALSLPGHPGTDPAAGADRLRTLIAAGDTLLPEERMLAQLLLQAANRLEVLETAARGTEQRQARELAAQATALNAEHAAELERALAQNAQLRRELDEAKETLDALTNIERSINERDGNEN